MSADVTRNIGRFVGLEEPKSLVTRYLEIGEIVTSRTTWLYQNDDTPVRMEMTDGYLLCLQRRYLPAYQYWVNGKPTQAMSLNRGQFLFLDLNDEHASIVRGEVDCLSLFVSRAALDRFIEEHDLGPCRRFLTANGVAFSDPVIGSLGEALVPALERPKSVSHQSADYVSTALLTHLTERYCELDFPPRRLGSRLAPWQEARAKEMLLESFGGDIGMAELARECGMARVPFLRAFKATVGMSPPDWQLSQKIERAKGLLLSTNLTIAEIGVLCGFADEYDFARHFASAIGTSPAYWRRY